MDTLDLKCISPLDRGPNFPFGEHEDISNGEIKKEMLQSPNPYANDVLVEDDQIGTLGHSDQNTKEDGQTEPTGINGILEADQDGQQDSDEDVALTKKSFNVFVREICKDRLDTRIPITMQPGEAIQLIVDSCLDKFPNCPPEVARKRVRVFLKNCRKNEKKRTGSRKNHDEDGKPAKKKKKKEKSLPQSPWAVLSLSEFLQYRCPSCIFFCKEESLFLDHAYEYHKESVLYLCTLTTLVDYVGLEPDNFDNDFPWNADEMASNDLKDEDETSVKADDMTPTEKPQLENLPEEFKPDVKCKEELKESENDDVNPGSPKDEVESLDGDGQVELSHQCQSCPKVLSSQIKLKKHMASAHGVKPDLKCPKCELTFGSQGKLNQHRLRIHHEGAKTFQCDQCSSSFIEKYRLTRHVESVHSSVHNYVCDKCPKTFKAANKLKRHVLSFHDQVRRHLCDQCDKSFFAMYELRAHKAYKHENVKNYQCDKCPNTYSTSTGLKRHCASVHGEGIQCPKCDRRVPNQWDLYRHIAQSHEGVRKHKCQKCTKAFILPKDLERHITSIHDGIKAEVCDICHKAFALKGNLVAHKKKVHKDSTATYSSVQTCTEKNN